MTKNGLIKNWKEIEQVGQKTEINGKEQYFIPMDAHGSSKTKIIMSFEDELNLDFEWYEDNKFGKQGTLFLIGTNY